MDWFSNFLFFVFSFSFIKAIFLINQNNQNRKLVLEHAICYLKTSTFGYHWIIWFASLFFFFNWRAQLAITDDVKELAVHTHILLCKTAFSRSKTRKILNLIWLGRMIFFGCFVGRAFDLSISILMSGVSIAHPGNERERTSFSKSFP